MEKISSSQSLETEKKSESKNTSSNEVEKVKKEIEQKKQLPEEIAKKFDHLKQYATTDEQKKQLHEWKEKALKGNEKAISKLIGPEYEQRLIVSKAQKRALDIVGQTNLNEINKKKAIDFINSIITTRDGYLKSFDNKLKTFQSYDNFREYQNNFFNEYKNNKDQRDEMLDSKIEGSNVKIFSTSEIKKHKKPWKKVIEYFKEGKHDEPKVRKIMNESLPKITKEKKEREDTAKEFAQIREVFEGLDDKKSDPGSAVSFGKLLSVKKFNSSSLQDRKNIIHQINQKAIKAKVFNVYGHSKSPESFKDYFTLEKSWRQSSIEEFKDKMENEWTEGRSKGWRKAYTFFKEKVDFLQKEKGSNPSVEFDTYLHKFQKDQETCQRKIEEKVNNIKNNITEISDEENGLDWQPSLQKHQEHLAYFEDLPSDLRSKFQSTENLIQQNITKCQRELVQENNSNEKKKEEATAQEAKEAILKGGGLGNNIIAKWLTNALVAQAAKKESDRNNSSTGEGVVSKTETITQEQLMKRKEQEIEQKEQNSIIPKNNSDPNSSNNMSLSLLEKNNSLSQENQSEKENNITEKAQQELVTWEVSDGIYSQETVKRNAKKKIERSQEDEELAILKHGRVVGENEIETELKQQANNVFEGSNWQQGAYLAITEMRDMSSSRINTLLEKIGRQSAADDYEYELAA